MNIWIYMNIWIPHTSWITPRNWSYKTLKFIFAPNTLTALFRVFLIYCSASFLCESDLDSILIRKRFYQESLRLDHCYTVCVLHTNQQFEMAFF